MISVHFQGKPINITVIQVYAPTTNAEEAEQFYDDLQDFLGLTPKTCPFHHRGLECKSRKSRDTGPCLALAQEFTPTECPWTLGTALGISQITSQSSPVIQFTGWFSIESPQIHVHSEPVNVILFWNVASAEITKLHWVGVGDNLKNSILPRNGECGHTDTQRHEEIAWE